MADGARPRGPGDVGGQEGRRTGRRREVVKPTPSGGGLRGRRWLEWGLGAEETSRRRWHGGGSLATACPRERLQPQQEADGWPGVSQIQFFTILCMKTVPNPTAVLPLGWGSWGAGGGPFLTAFNGAKQRDQGKSAAFPGHPDGLSAELVSEILSWEPTGDFTPPSFQLVSGTFLGQCFPPSPLATLQPCSGPWPEKPVPRASLRPVPSLPCDAQRGEH